MAPSRAPAKANKTPKSKNNANPPKKNHAAKRAGLAGAGEISSAKIPLELQQLLLNIFRNAFPDRMGPGLKPLLQEVKQHLYNRDFLAAFGEDEYLEAYAVRWSPSRALGYLQIFSDLGEHVLRDKEPGRNADGNPYRIVCLGGGAGAEIVGLAGFLKMLAQKESPPQDGDVTSYATDHRFEVTAVDIANWSPIVGSLGKAITTAPTLSTYASAAAREANAELLQPEIFRTKSVQRDLLSVASEDLLIELKEMDLVTLMFTLNELYSASLAKTQNFLLQLTSCLLPGTLLLVVDSPGSYSSVTLNGAEKKYPMHWLLDHTLLATPTHAKSKEEGPRWEKIFTDESRWFRLPEGLKYPIELENMRYQIHLYKRLPEDHAPSGKGR